jgi:uncharacterized protein (DUF2062 family)
METVFRTALRLPRLPRYYFLRVKRMKGDPEYLARSFAFGIFMGVLPLIPVQTIILVPLTILLRVSTITAMLAGYVVSNPLTFAPQYYTSWKLGNAIFPGWVTWEQIHAALQIIIHPDPQFNMIQGILHGLGALSKLGFKAIAVMETGGAIIGFPIALLSYFLALKFFITVRQQRAMKHRLNNTK